MARSYVASDYTDVKTRLSTGDCERLARSLVETYLGIDNSEYFPEYESDVEAMTRVTIKAAKHAKMFQAKKARQ